MSSTAEGAEGLRSIPALLKRNATQFGDAPAYREKEYGIWQSWSWAETEQEIEALALGLLNLGVAKGDYIAIIGHNRPYLYWSVVAAQCVGAIPVPLYQDAVAEEMEYVLDHCGARFAIVADQEQADKVIQVQDDLHQFEHLVYIDPRGLRKYDHTHMHQFSHVQEQGRAAREEFGPELERRRAALGYDDTCVMLYTSGTTGKPKGVVLSNRNIIEAAKSSSEFDHLRQDDSVLAYLPMAWVGDFIFSIGQAYWCGFCVNCPEAPQTMYENLHEIGPTYFFAPPRYFEERITALMIRMEDAGPVKRQMFTYFLDFAKFVGEEITLARRGDSGQDKSGLAAELVSIALRSPWLFGRIVGTYLFSLEALVLNSVRSFAFRLMVDKRGEEWTWWNGPLLSLLRLILPRRIGDRLVYQTGEQLVYGPVRNRAGMSNVRVAYTAGEAIGPEIFEFWRSLGINLKQLYGQTEASVFITVQPDGEVRSDTVGVPAPGVEIRIGENGEVYYRSPGTFVEYYKNPESTRETKDPEGWVATGDAGFIEEDTGHLRIIDRAKDVAKMSDGALFAPKYVENKLKFYPNILEAVVFGAGRDRCCAFINIDLSAVGNWAERNNIAYASYQELAQHPQVLDMVQGHVEEVNESVAQDDMLSGCQVHRFLILHKELDADDGELTRTRKVRRKIIGEKFDDLVTALYEGAEEIYTETEVTYEDGRKGKIKATLKIRDAKVVPVQTKAVAAE